ncbi:MAG: class I SAM-dependent methyltransferase [Pirellulales bacterium]
MLRAQAYGEAYYREHAEAGCDYAAYGDFERRYGRAVVDTFGWEGRTLLDVGCACGAQLRGIVHAGAFAGYGVDLNEHMITLGRRQWGDELRLSVCDAVDLHGFPDAVFDAVHSHQSAEHWRPQHVQFILTELLRVTRPGGRLVVNLDTTEIEQSGARKDDSLEHDPTHVCIRPLSWWREHLVAAGWDDETDRWQTATLTINEVMGQRAWAWFVGQRK